MAKIYQVDRDYWTKVLNPSRHHRNASHTGETEKGLFLGQAIERLSSVGSGRTIG